MEKAPPSVGDPPQTDPVYLASPPFLQEMWLSLAGTFINGTRAANCLLFFYFRYSSLIVAERSKGLLEVQEIQGMVKKAYWTATYLNGMVLNGFWILGCSLFLILFSYVELTYTLPLDLILICHVAVCMSIFVASFLQKSQNVILIWLLLWFIMNFGTELPIGFSLFPMIGVFNFLNNVGYQLPLFQSPRFLTFVGSWIVLFIGVIVADFSQFYGQFMKMVSKPSKTQRKMAEVKLQLDLDEREASIIAEEKTIDELESEGIYPETESLRLVHLTKQYRDKLAVNNISLRVKKNETFGIIGPNGAGKSTTFKMIYNAEKPTSGVVYLDSKYGNHGYVGVCQQKDIFWDYLTVLEHLKFYSLMNGVPENQLEEWVEYICKLALLHKDIWQCVPFMLSGGMKRRLSIAISIVGKRDTIILDEPSAGLDPGTRIKLWKTIEQLRTDDSKSVVLTTHLMDEAEALCDRIGIINYGKLIALGTTAELKALYGNMLKLNILAIVKKDHDKSIEETCKLRVDAISHATVSELDSKAVLIRQSLALRKNGEKGHMYLQFGIVKDGTSDMISLLKKVDPFCAKNGISEFGFSETTLDEVFLYVMANLK
jgi:ABC-type multidrug transport system ATPase subunit